MTAPTTTILVMSSHYRIRSFWKIIEVDPHVLPSDFLEQTKTRLDGYIKSLAQPGDIAYLLLVARFRISTPNISREVLNRVARLRRRAEVKELREALS